MKADDFDAVVEIDRKVVNAPRTEYYEMKFERLFSSTDYLPTSLVAETEEGKEETDDPWAYLPSLFCVW